MLLVQMCSNASVSIVQCAKQPLGSKACGLYTCENLSESKEYTNSWKKLKEAVKNRGETMKNECQAFKQIKADICKFILEKCVLEGEPFFDNEGELAVRPEFEKLRRWNTMLRSSDYTQAVEL